MISDPKTFNQLVDLVQQLSPTYQQRLASLLQQILRRPMPALNTNQESVDTAVWLPDFFERTAGAWQGEKLVRPEQGEFETRLDLL